MFRVFNLLTAGIALTLAVAAMPDASSAQDKKAVEARQKLMKGMSSDMKAVAAFVKNGKGSAADAEQHLMMVASASEKIPGLFPKGTDLDKLGLKVTGAKPAIWEERDKFEKAAEHLGSEARKFAAVVKAGDKGAMTKMLGSFGKGTCGACHSSFRTKRPK
jgi:cytochrome c556